MTLSSINYKYAPTKCKMQKIGIHFFQTCRLNCKNMKFDSNSNKEVSCLETSSFPKVSKTWIETKVELRSI